MAALPFGPAPTFTCFHSRFAFDVQSLWWRALFLSDLRFRRRRGEGSGRRVTDAAQASRVNNVYVEEAMEEMCVCGAGDDDDGGAAQLL